MRIMTMRHTLVQTRDDGRHLIFLKGTRVAIAYGESRGSEYCDRTRLMALVILADGRLYTIDIWTIDIEDWIRTWMR